MKEDPKYIQEIIKRAKQGKARKEDFGKYLDYVRKHWMPKER